MVLPKESWLISSFPKKHHRISRSPQLHSGANGKKHLNDFKKSARHDFLISEIHWSKQWNKIGIRWLMMAADVSDGQMDVSENSGFSPQILHFNIFQ